jgi:pyrrolidone-carboxylate peptidase
MTIHLKQAASAAVVAFCLAGCGADVKSPSAGGSTKPASAPTSVAPAAPSAGPTAAPSLTSTPTTPLDLPPSQIPPDNPAPAPVAAVQYANCMNSQVSGTYEEQYLANTMESTDTTPFSQQILAASGFDTYAPQFTQQLCTDGAIKTFADAVSVVKTAGDALWQAAVDRVQGRKVVGTLPQSDDRMLYWAHLQMTLALRQWVPQVAFSTQQRAQLQWLLEKSSRGQYSIAFPAGANIKRIIISGFDPFQLGSPGVQFPGDAIKTGNPSGAIALALDGKQITLADGSTAVIQSYLLPVDFEPFREGMQENTLAPFFTGPDAVLASVTMSQGGPDEFWLENWHGRFHGQGADNMGTIAGGDVPGALPSSQDADIYPPVDILGYQDQPWSQNQPEQFTTTTLPIAQIIAADTGSGVAEPGSLAYLGLSPAATAARAAQLGPYIYYSPTTYDGYAVVWHTPYEVFPDCTNSAGQSFPGNSYDALGVMTLIPPLPTACALEGSGGYYLSNESGYRNTVLRDTLNPSIVAGHMHTPIMTNFVDGDDDLITDALFESYRDSIVQQATAIMTTLAGTL